MWEVGVELVVRVMGCVAPLLTIEMLVVSRMQMVLILRIKRIALDLVRVLRREMGIMMRLHWRSLALDF